MDASMHWKKVYTSTTEPCFLPVQDLCMVSLNPEQSDLGWKNWIYAGSIRCKPIQEDEQESRCSMPIWTAI